MNAKDRAVLARWRGRLKIRQGLLNAARRRHEWNPTAESRRVLELRKDQVAYAERVIERRTGGRPKIVRLAVSIALVWGALGGVQRTIGHYTAGPRDTSDAHAIALWRGYHAQHKAQGWGGIGYHIGITSAGTIVLLRPVNGKGAHTAGKNTGSIGIVVHGAPGQRMTERQRAALAWLYDNAHTAAMPASHRTPRSLNDVPHTVHRDHNATQCPDTYASDYKAA